MHIHFNLFKQRSRLTFLGNQALKLLGARFRRCQSSLGRVEHSPGFFDGVFFRLMSSLTACSQLDRLAHVLAEPEDSQVKRGGGVQDVAGAHPLVRRPLQKPLKRGIDRVAHRGVVPGGHGEGARHDGLLALAKR